MRRFWETWLRNITWFALLLVLLPAIVGGIGYYTLRTYEAKSTIWVEPQIGQSAGDPWKPKTAADIYATRLSQLLLTNSFRGDVLESVSSRTTLTIAGEAHRAALIAGIAKNVKVAVAGPYLIEVIYRDESAVVARETLSAIVEGFQRETVELKGEAGKRIADLYEQQLQQARDSIAAAQAAKADPVVIQSRIDLLRTIEERRNEVYGTTLVGTLSVPATLFVVDEANTPEKRTPNTTQVLLGILAALVVTLALELGVVGLLTVWDRSVRNTEDVADLAGVPAFGMARVRAMKPPENLKTGKA